MHPCKGPYVASFGPHPGGAGVISFGACVAAFGPHLKEHGVI